MKFVSEARVATPHARKYAAQLGKHWAHDLSVAEDGDARCITFPRDARGASWTGDAFIMDEGETTVRAGDIVVQRGTNHGRANRTDRNCRICFVLIDGEFEEDLRS